MPSSTPAEPSTTLSPRDLKPQQQSAALEGATRAFHSKPVSPHPTPTTYSGHNGALAAATKVGRVGAGPVPHAEKHLPNTTPASKATDPWPVKAGAGVVGKSKGHSSSPDNLLSPVSRQSPSYIAATLAASRATPAPQSPTSPLALLDRRSISPASTKDESPIPPTHRLVQLFEAGQASSEPAQQQPRTTILRPTQAILSPVPVRPARPLPEPTKSLRDRSRHSPSPSSLSSDAVLQDEQKITRGPITKPAPKTISMEPTLSKTVKPTAASVKASTVKSRPTLPPLQTEAPPRDTGTPESSSDSSYASAEDEAPPPQPSVAAAKDSKHVFSTLRTTARSPPPTGKNPPPVVKPQPTTAAARPSITSPHRIAKSPESTTASPSAPTRSPLPPARSPMPTTRGPPAAAPPPRPASAASRRGPSRAASRLKPQLTADSLADAMVASSLASSRVPSPTKGTYSPVGGTWRRGSHLLVPASPGTLTARTPSPLKTNMRQTLRRTESSDVTDRSRERSKSRERGGGRHGLLRRKHPHKHAEGDRRRWRDSITPQERKRYEGVWAANRGLRIAPDDAPDDVHGYAVRDLWSRSGLDAATLEQVWDLVAAGGRPAMQHRCLRREEFVVGLWLVDQSLKGRRLPVEVSDSVWASARTLTAGILAR